jgi:hypothetical protein
MIISHMRSALRLACQRCSLASQREVLKEEIDRYLKQQRADYEAKRQAARATDPMFYQKMADARRHLLITP